MRVATIAARGGAVIGLLILGAIAIVSPGENDQKTALGAVGKVAPTATSFCAGPAPPSGEIEARPGAPDKVFADFDRMEADFHRTGIAGMTRKQTRLMVRRLQSFYGAPECSKAEQRLAMALKIDHAVDINETDEIVQKLKARAIEGDVGGRRTFAATLERKFLSEGKDFHINAVGEKGTTLRVEWVLIGRPFAYKVANETDFLRNAKERGFRTVEFTDGYGRAWTYDLSKM
jgi:hypothetical protein